jgi:hypothetical protein
MLKIMNLPLEGSDKRAYRSRESGLPTGGQAYAIFLRRTKNTGLNR